MTATLEAPFSTLVEHGLFLTKEPGPTDRFRYHSLFADLLRYQLAAEDSTAEARYRRRAAQWLAEHHEYVACVDQLLAAGDHEGAFLVIATEGHRLFEAGDAAVLLRLLTAVHHAFPAPPAELAIHLLAAQVAADEFISAAETYRRLRQRSDLSPGLRVAADTLASSIGLGHLPLAEMHRLSDGVLISLKEVARETVPDLAGVGGADTCETLAALISSIALFLEGNLESSIRGLERTLDLPGTQYPVWRIHVLGMTALTRTWQGLLTEPDSLATSALEVAEEFGAVDHIAAAWAHLALAAIHHDRVEPRPAGIHLDAARLCISRCRRSVYADLLHIQEVRSLAATDGTDAALELLRNTPPRRVHRPIIERALSTLEAQLLIRSGAVHEARRLTDSVPEPIPAARIDALVASGNVLQARRVLSDWNPPTTDLRASIERDLRVAVVTHQEARPGVAGTLVADVAVRADTEGLLTPFVDAPLALSLLRTAAPTRPLRRMRRLLDTTRPNEGRDQGSYHLIEQLTPRERVVLEYFPSRLGNEQIAQALYVSVNTLKTHLRNIYRKLDAPSRDTAVERATRIGLI